MGKIQIRPQGTRVRIRRGRLPLDPAVEGKSGTVVHLLKGSGDRYGVQLDGEAGISVFTEDELEALAPENPAGGPEPKGGATSSGASE